MVLAADDVGDAEVDVVDHARQQIEPAAVLAPDHRVAEQFRVEPLGATDQIGPFDRRVMIEPEAPVRRAALGRRRAAGLALVDRRKPAPEQHLAAEIELLWRFVTGIDASGGLQPFELAFVQIEPLRLAHHHVGIDPEPAEIVADRGIELGRRALGVGVVDAQDELAAVLLREQEIVQRGADIADVEPAGRRGGEAGDGHGVFAIGPVWKALVIG